MTKDLTHGNPMGLILSFGIPLFFGCLFRQLYNVVDTAIVRKTLGGAALAAVGATSSINFLVVGFCTGVCSGLSIPVARAFGARQEQDLRRYVTGGTWLCVLFAVLLTVGTVLFCPAILRTMNTPEDIVARSYQYGALFYFPLSLVNIIRFLIQGMGFSPLTTFAGLLEMVARGATSFLVPYFGFTAACFASPAAWIFADIFLIFAYLHCHRQLQASAATPILPQT